MKKPFYFDQLFEKLSNGQYRERQTPVPPLDICHRHDFVRSEKTGRICVVYPAMTWDDMVRRGTAKIVPSSSNPSDQTSANNWLHDWGYGMQRPEEQMASWSVTK